MSNRVVDLSGYSFTGKSAIYDFLTDYSNVKAHGVETDFDLFRSKNGILNSTTIQLKIGV